MYAILPATPRILARATDPNHVDDEHDDLSRLSGADHATAARTAADTAALWLAGSSGNWNPGVVDALALMRVTAGAIGSAPHELRLAELDELASIVLGTLIGVTK